MSALGYVTVTAIVLSGAAAIIVNRQAIRRWVVFFYLILMAFLAFGIFFVGPRLALSRIESAGGVWTAEKAAGALAMHQAAVVQGGTLLLIAAILSVLVFRRPT